MNTLIKYGANSFFHSNNLKKFESLQVNENPKGLNPPASDSIAKI